VSVRQVLQQVLERLELHLVSVLQVQSSQVQVVLIVGQRFHRLCHCSWFGCNLGNRQ
jgi:hypothetical protein